MPRHQVAKIEARVLPVPDEMADGWLALTKAHHMQADRDLLRAVYMVMHGESYKAASEETGTPRNTIVSKMRDYGLRSMPDRGGLLDRKKRIVEQADAELEHRLATEADSLTVRDLQQVSRGQTDQVSRAEGWEKDREGGEYGAVVSEFWEQLKSQGGSFEVSLKVTTPSDPAESPEIVDVTPNKG